ncbi:D-methionine transport system permease protein [Lederbergia wuyishanensis]|uniref:D-methionine transport system permease protein n=2 Tax=Lederbergia wuyishanensis TaxID=1347903 RepID=A0ABU0DAL7_9BACI|nr:methionine ABC transporter permease [Lederbergia wuyishanensis]MCJ8009669.1 ABC transporter permease [Lederbergia wuyishanensis]MDQ0345457.1 D-methionine transport system permease protein [Lederbergia wuyishanensis]
MVIEHIIEMLPDLNKAFFETIYMVGISLLVAILIGLPLGVILFVTDEGMFMEQKLVKTIVGFLINLIRSIPFIILLVLLIPFTMLIVGKVIGPTAASVSISVAAIPFFARIVETAFREIDKGVIEASISVGATPWMIIKDVLIPEAKSSIIQGVTLTTISLVAYSAMAGVVGGGGIGDLAIRYGYYRYDTVIMFTTVLVLIVLVQLIQLVGDSWAKHADKR